jgi:hypothetical protein
VDKEPSGETAELPPTTAPATIDVTLRGFADKEAAERFGHLIAETARSIGRYIDLGRLDGITVAFDYDEALSQIDRGVTNLAPLIRTRTQQLTGEAMSVPVLRDGSVKSHMVYHAPCVLALENEGIPEFWTAVHLVAHECGHVEDLKNRDEAFPATILRQPLGYTEAGILGLVSEILWEEYAASRASSFFGELQTAIYEEGLISVLAVARTEANAAIRSYRLHGDLRRALDEAGTPLSQPLKMAAYLVGHLDGLGLNFDSVPKAHEQLAASPYQAFIAQMANALRQLWSRRNCWASPSEFYALNEVVRDVLANGGLILRTLPDGRIRLDIPFTQETMPY